MSDMGAGTSDIGCREFAEMLAQRQDHYPASDRYIQCVHDSRDKTGRTEREHMIGWFSDNETIGSGAYSRSVPNRSAGRCYSRLQNAASLLWIAEAVGVPDEQVWRAYDAAVGAGDRRRACGAIRRVIPWEDISSRATALMTGF